MGGKKTIKHHKIIKSDNIRVKNKWKKKAKVEKKRLSCYSDENVTDYYFQIAP